MVYVKVTDSFADAAIEPLKVESSSTLKEVNPRVIEKGVAKACAVAPPPPPPPPQEEMIIVISNNCLNRIILLYKKKEGLSPLFNESFIYLKLISKS